MTACKPRRIKVVSDPASLQRMAGWLADALESLSRHRPRDFTARIARENVMKVLKLNLDMCNSYLNPIVPPDSKEKR